MRIRIKLVSRLNYICVAKIKGKKSILFIYIYIMFTFLSSYCFIFDLIMLLLLFVFVLARLVTASRGLFFFLRVM